MAPLGRGGEPFLAGVRGPLGRVRARLPRLAGGGSALSGPEGEEVGREGRLRGDGSWEETAAERRGARRPPWQRPSSVPPRLLRARMAPLWAARHCRRERPGLCTPSHCLGCSSEPPPKPLTPLPVYTAGAPGCRTPRHGLRRGDRGGSPAPRRHVGADGVGGGGLLGAGCGETLGGGRLRPLRKVRTACGAR